MAERFELCVEKLLDGEVICALTDSDLFAYLEDEEQLQNVNMWLLKLHRLVAQTADKRGFYCVYSDLNDDRRKRLVRLQFEEISRDFVGLVEWLRLCRSISHEARPIEAGDIVRESELLAAIENSQTLAVQLEGIADKFQRAKNSTISNRLRSILGYLENQGYLRLNNTSGSVYTATAKWSLVYDMLEFIASCELLDDNQDTAIQTELF